MVKGPNVVLKTKMYSPALDIRLREQLLFCNLPCISSFSNITISDYRIEMILAKSYNFVLNLGKFVICFHIIFFANTMLTSFSRDLIPILIHKCTVNVVLPYP